MNAEQAIRAIEPHPFHDQYEPEVRESLEAPTLYNVERLDAEQIVAATAQRHAEAGATAAAAYITTLAAVVRFGPGDVGYDALPDELRATVLDSMVADLEAKAARSAKQAATDREREATRVAALPPEDERCDRCGGRGGHPGWPGFTCWDCGGSGRRA